MTRGSGYFGVAALDALAREVARAPLPPVDWDRVERNVLAIVEARHETPVAPPSPPLRTIGSPWSIALAAAAVVAIVRIAPNAGTRVSEVPHVVTASTAAGARTLKEPLERGDVAEAGAESLRYEARGAVTFTLAPSSRVQMLSEVAPTHASGAMVSKAASSPAMTVALLEGSIHAEVVPHPDGEVFAVEVGQTRVAAHGTSFTVTRDGDRVVVDIAHGSVAVGPIGHPGSTHGWLLVGPDKASFSLDGATEATWSSEPPAVAEANPADAAPNLAAAVSDEPHAEAVEALAPLPARATRRAEIAARARVRASNKLSGDASSPGNAGNAADRQKAIATILGRLGACYERQVSSFGVRFSIRSSLTLTVLPNGTVREGLFDPPLSPTLMTCARDVIAASRFPQESATTVVSVPVTLQPSP
jgi:hypothetical protein